MASDTQGDILKIEKINHLVLVASKDFFNTSGEIIGCPIIKHSNPGPLHIWMFAKIMTPFDTVTSKTSFNAIPALFNISFGSCVQ